MSTDSVKHYLNLAGKIPLLTPAEEIELGRSVQKMMLLLETKPEGPYTMSEKRTLRTGKRAKDRMITANLRLVAKVASKYIVRCQHLEMVDLFQEGVVGMIRAVEKFDPEKGYKFSTYAYWWIRQGMGRAAAQMDRSIRLPSNATDCLIKARYFIYDYQAKHGKVPSVADIAEHCGVSLPIMKEYLHHNQRPRSLDERCGGNDSSDDRSTVLELVTGDVDSPWDYVDQQEYLEHHGTLHREINNLPPQQQQIIQLRFILPSEEDGHDFFQRSQVKTAEKLGVTRQCVQSQEIKAIRKLRLALNKSPVRNDYGRAANA